jgi:hypothetical protein
MRYLLLLLPLLMMGCAGKHNYMTADGALIETTAEMAYLMSVRDVERERVGNYHAAIAQAQRPEQVVALMAGLLAAPGQRVERPRTWDERALPWVQTLMPLAQGLSIGGGGGGSENVTVWGTGNSVVLSNRNATMSESYSYPVVSPTTDDWTPEPVPEEE